MYGHNYSKGSRWRKWDLHIHAPSSALNNQFEGSTQEEKWEKYLDKLENLDDIAVLGITDYFSIRGYRKVKEYKNQENLQNIDLIVPNVELRILPVTDHNNSINLHVIFSPDIVSDLESKFFSSLEFSYSGDTYKCTKEDLIKLGKKYNNDELNDEVAYKEGVLQYKVTVEDLREVFANSKTLRENSIVLVSNSSQDGNSGIQHSSLAATRENIYRFSHCIFSSNPNDRKYFLGKKADDPSEIKRKYNNLLPCIHGSDAHCLDNICEPDYDRYTWIKADPTFNGFKHILYEPEERVVVSNINPREEFKKPYFSEINISETKLFNDKSVKFGDNEFSLNPNLITIIGGRGAGKSLLLDSIGKTFTKYTSDNKNNRAENISIKNNKFNIKYKKEDGSSIDYYIQDNNHLDYLHIHQNEVKSIVEDISNLDKEIKRMLGIKNYDYSDNLEDYIYNNVDRIIEIKDWFEYEDTNNNFINSREYNESIKKKNKELIETVTTEANKALIKEFRENNTNINKVEDKIDDINKLKQKIKKEIENANSKIVEINLFSNSYEIDEHIPEIDVEKQLKSIKNLLERLPKIKKELTKKNKKIENKFRELGIEGDISTLLEKINKNQKEIEKCNKKLMEIDEKEKEYNELIEDRKNISHKIKENLDTQVEKINNKFKQLKQGKNSWNEDQKDLVNILLEDIEVYGEINFDINIFYEIITKHLNNIKFKATKNKSVQERIKNTLNVVGFDSYLKLIANEPIIELDDQHITLEKFLNESDYFTNEGEKEFIKSLYIGKYRNKFLKVMSKIKYKGKEPMDLSVGERGTLFICMKLATDTFSSPFIFDQPEDDLDNDFIMNELVPIFKKIKKYRQVIIATHNANIVVNADAEQVIVANNDKEKITYESGSLENRKFRNYVCGILEGGEKAFEKRQQKYGFKEL